MRFRRSALALALTLSVLPGTGLAQTTVSLYQRSGLLAPDAYFYEQFENFVADPPTQWSTGSLGRSFVAGVGMEVGFGRSGVLLRGEILRSFDSWLLVSHSRIVPRQLFTPPYIEVAWLDVPYTMTMTSLQIVLPLQLRVWRAQPYVSAGAGGKFYGFGEPTLPNSTRAILPADGFTWGGDVGAGILIHLAGAVTVDLQARSAITRYWEKTQSDFIYSGALVWKVH